MTTNINSDLSKYAEADTNAMEWLASPSPNVMRKRLDHIGPVESGRVTSLVRFEPGASFPEHDHPQGEEILVLEGVFSDHTGDYGAGGYLLNPEGFRHAPFSKEGCTLFVKLRQYEGTDRPHVSLRTGEMEWSPGQNPGTWVKMLFSHPDYKDATYLIKAEPGCEVPRHDHPGGEEIFVLEGTLEDEFGRHGPGKWVRNPPGSSHAPKSPDGAIVYVKVGGLV